MKFAPSLTFATAHLAASFYEPSEVIIDDIRVQALAPNLVRVEPKGPHGFEDRTTFVIENRSFAGIPISVVSRNASGTVLRTEHYDITLPAKRECTAPLASTGVVNAQRVPRYPDGLRAVSREACCNACLRATECVSWLYTEHTDGQFDVNCWPLSNFDSLNLSSPMMEVGFSRLLFKVMAKDGEVVYDSAQEKRAKTNLLHWPSPLSDQAYALMDFPRFYVPEWGAAKVDKHFGKYDFRNNIAGDTYVFLLGSDLPSWQSARERFIDLTGPTPVLPDYAYGIWFTFWHEYTEAEAKDDIDHWNNLKLPIDVWGLDMNWRHGLDARTFFYEFPNKELFPDFSEFFSYLKEHKLRTYFNDHPFPVKSFLSWGLAGEQGEPAELEFRWNGLSKWLDRGLTFWWFDFNWGFSIPPPHVREHLTLGTITHGDTPWHSGQNWDGLDNAAWGSHVYYSIINGFDRTVRDKKKDDFYGGRPIALTKFGELDWRPGLLPELNAENPAHHRYPVWWTGDDVPLEGAVEAHVDSGIHGFKPFVHSDCGGDDGSGDSGSPSRPVSKGLFLRWFEHCALGSIFRIHGGDHRPWKYNDTAHLDSVREYLKLRHRLHPALLAAGQRSTRTGIPFVARGDFFWPEHGDSRSNHQYIFIDSLLVAPIMQDHNNTRSVWVPPGTWEDAWDGSLVTGPQTIAVTQPFERIPLWHARDGSFLVIFDNATLRVEEQEWRTLTVEAFPSTSSASFSRLVHERCNVNCDWNTPTEVSIFSNKSNVHVEVAAGNAAPSDREWLIRLHLLPGQRVEIASVDGRELPAAQIRHIAPIDKEHAARYFPLQGAGQAPPPNAGFVAEITIPHNGSVLQAAFSYSDGSLLVI